MDSWKKLICKGNRSLEHGRLDDAAGDYFAALAEADRCLACQAQACVEAEASGGCAYLDAVAAVGAYVVTRLNLADLCLRLDRSEDAAEHLRAMQARLSHIIDDGNQPWTLRAAALRNSRRAQDAVLSFVEEHGMSAAACAIEQRITHLPPSSVLH